jgi:hypothetical protein
MRVFSRGLRVAPAQILRNPDFRAHFAEFEKSFAHPHVHAGEPRRRDRVASHSPQQKHVDEVVTHQQQLSAYDRQGDQQKFVEYGASRKIVLRFSGQNHASRHITRRHDMDITKDVCSSSRLLSQKIWLILSRRGAMSSNRGLNFVSAFPYLPSMNMHIGLSLSGRRRDETMFPIFMECM